MHELPPAVEIELTRTSLRDYWVDRLYQHVLDCYAGLPLAKFPEDLRLYEHLIWLARPDVIIEIGTFGGGSALWLRDRLLTLATYGHISRPHVISVDLDMSQASAQLETADPRYAEEITLVEADILDPALPSRVEDLIPASARCLVIEDSAHVYDTTWAALAGFARFVPEGGFFVVEDGCIDVEEMRPDESWPRGVLPAVRDWLRTPEGEGFTARRDLELYGISCHPEGFLQRRPKRGR
jgi:cephalosporin hydroxylase